MPFTTAEAMTRVGFPPEQAKLVAGLVGGNTPLQGTFTMNGATPVVVANANLQAGDMVQFMLRTPGGTVGAYPSIKTRTNGTGFTVAGTASDTSVYEYRIFKA
jgi:hypothetical protein